MKTKSIFFCLVFAACVNISITAKAQAVNVNDSLALVDLYISTDGTNPTSGWYNHTNWLTEKPVNTWYGITVTGTRVTGITLPSNHLEGTIPASFDNLKGLTFLDLYGNFLTGSIPSFFGNLTNLERLYIINNAWSGSIPAELGNLINLTVLEIGSYELGGSIPSALGNLVNLKEFYLHYSPVSGSIPSSFANLSKLEAFLLEGTQVSGNIPSFFGSLTNLKGLSLSGNQLTGVIPSSFGNLVNLDGLELAGNQLSGDIPVELGNLVNMKSLVLSHNQLTGSIPSSLGNLVKLEQLDLSYNKLSGSLPSSLGNLTNLKGLQLHNNKLSGSIPASIAKLRRLGYFLLSYNQFTFNGMQFIQRTFPNAKYDHQALIPIHQNGNALSVSAGGTLERNTYNWVRVTKTSKTVVATISGDSVFHPSQKGVYLVRVTNSIATGLTLRSDTIHYTAPDEFAEPASFEDMLQQNDKTNRFLIFPNPAKDVLHVQINGKAIVSLADQSGKVLLTTIISGNGIINVSNLKPGLYYLKNTATGAVQKIIVSR